MSCPDSRSFTPGNFFNASLKFFVELAHSFASTATALNGVFFTLSTLDAVTVNSSNISASSGITGLLSSETNFPDITHFPLFGDTLSISFTTIPALRGKDEKNRSKMFNTLIIYIFALFFRVQNYMVFTLQYSNFGIYKEPTFIFHKVLVLCIN